MKTNPTIIAAAIIGLSIFLSAVIHAVTTRYTPIVPDGAFYVLTHDNWTGNFYNVKGVKVPSSKSE